MQREINEILTEEQILGQLMEECAELIQALNRLKVQTGSLACLSCGYEHNCSTKGCRILWEAVEQLEKKRSGSDERGGIKWECG